ncbi:MAG: hypothetical protein ED558_14210 [Oricola sp.]|nr:MAG: hypothetical protein ED558_14210 [Oricola sp.]
MAELTPATLETAPIATIEQPIVDRLRLAFPPRNFTIERVPSTMTLREFQRHARATPFVGLAWLGLDPDEANGRQLKAKMRWRAILITSARTLEARFKGDARDIGLDAMIDVLSLILNGWTIAGIGAVTVTGAKAVFAEGNEDDDVAIAQVDFSVAYVARLAAMQIKTAADLQAIDIQWLAGGDTPPAAGTQTLEQNQEG